MFMVYAATPWGDCVREEAATIQCFEPLFRNVVQSLVALVGVAVFIMFIVGGFNFLFSGGDQKKLEKARGTLTGAIAGIMVIIASYLILLTIRALTGVDVTTFSIPSN